MKLKTNQIVLIGLLSAIAYIMVFAVRITVLPGVDFLKYEPKDIVIVIGGFILGPMVSLLVSVVTSFLELITISSTGPIGFLMNVMSTAAFACTASYIYSKKRSIKGAVSGLIAGGVLMTGIMVVWNYLITPIYMQVPRDVVVGMLVPAIIPFNLIKATLNAGLSILLYRAISGAFKKAGIIEKREGTSSVKHNYWGIYIVTGIILVSVVFVLLAMNRII